MHPAVTGLRLWDDERRYSDDIGPDYCRQSCVTRCAECPAPTLLPEAAPGAVGYALVRTQWRVGASGRTGLDYNACAWTWAANRERLQLPPDAELLEDVTVVEHAMLQADAERAERQRETRESTPRADPTMGG